MTLEGELGRKGEALDLECKEEVLLLMDLEMENLFEMKGKG